MDLKTIQSFRKHNVYIDFVVFLKHFCRRTKIGKYSNVTKDDILLVLLRWVNCTGLDTTKDYFFE